MADLVGMDILKPVLVLAGWTMVMWAWMYALRIPAIQKLPSEKTENWVGATGADLDNMLPSRVQWAAHNYNHLHEQPTVFYAVALVLAMIGQGDGLNALLAWIYVGIRIGHSVFQATANRVVVRFVIFSISSLVLIALIIHAMMVVF